MASEPTADTAPVQPTAPAKGPRWGTGSTILPMALALFVGLVAGLIVGAAWSPWFVNDVVRREFLTGPPAAGAFAVLAALLAAGAAVWSTHVTRRNAEAAVKQARQSADDSVEQARKSAETAERWKRIEWSAEKALSAVESEWRAGFAACEALIDEGKCTPAERIMLQAALGLLSREAAGMDADDQEADNGVSATGGDQHE